MLFLHEMLELARRNQAEAGTENAEWLKGTIERVPLPANSIDVRPAVDRGLRESGVRARR